MSPRDDLKDKYPRCHYNKYRKAKQVFFSKESAENILEE